MIQSDLDSKCNQITLQKKEMTYSPCLPSVALMQSPRDLCVCVCVCIQSRQILEDSRKVPRLLLGLGLRLIEVGIVIPYEKSIWLVSREYKADLSPEGSEYINFC